LIRASVADGTPGRSPASISARSIQPRSVSGLDVEQLTHAAAGRQLRLAREISSPLLIHPHRPITGLLVVLARCRHGLSLLVRSEPPVKPGRFRVEKVLTERAAHARVTFESRFPSLPGDAWASLGASMTLDVDAGSFGDDLDQVADLPRRGGAAGVCGLSADRAGDGTAAPVSPQVKNVQREQRLRESPRGESNS
jgi:hypothetical protein